MHLLFAPFEWADAALASLLASSPPLAALLLACVLGLRHATDPDHLLAVTAVVADRGGDVRSGARIGAWWGAGHAAVLLAAGLPMIAVGAALPAWVATSAEHLVGMALIALAVRLLWRWARGHGTTPHGHPPAPTHGHVPRGGAPGHGARGGVRRAVALGALHGLAGTGAVVLLLVAALPTSAQALAALAIFAPMSVVSMTGCTAGYAWALTRCRVAAAVRGALVPATGAAGLLVGLWYSGVLTA